MEANGADVDEGAELGSIEMDTSMVFVFPSWRRESEREWYILRLWLWLGAKSRSHASEYRLSGQTERDLRPNNNVIRQ